jgi:glycosyltransferase involved in cell wall biosynthesis
VRRLLWIGDAAVATGFARVTHQVLDVLRETWDVGVLGLNYLGDPHPYPYPIWPCWSGGDAFGVRRTKALVAQLKPDLIVIQNDPWNIAAYLKEIDDACPVVATMAVDGKNCRAEEYRLNELALSIFWTRFGQAEAQRGGLIGRSTVIPLGVDTALYKPMDRLEARKTLGLPEHMHEAFIVGNVNRNQPRKRLDLTVQAFHRWLEKYEAKDAYLYLQVCPTGDIGYDVKQLKRYYDPSGRQWLVVVEPNIGHGVDERLLPAVYSAFDVQMTTTQGEGWGLTTMEGMACGVPQITPEWSALQEWTGVASIGVPCPTTAVTPNRVNVVGGVPDVEKTVIALQHLYQSAGNRRAFRDRGLELVSRPEYRWPAIGRAYAEALDQVPLRKEEAA